MEQSVGEQGEGPRVVILVEDDEAVRRSLQLLLHWRGYEVRSFARAAPVFARDLSDGAHVLVADYRLPDANGFEVLRELRRRGWAGRSVLITAFPTADLIQAATACGYDAVLEKPLRQQALVAALEV